MTRAKPRTYVCVVRSYGAKIRTDGSYQLAMTAGEGTVITHTTLAARDYEAARAEAQRLVGRDVLVVVPDLGENPPGVMGTVKGTR